jgi:ribonuclease VapC
VIIDTSGLIAILCDEPEAAAFANLIAIATTRRLSAASYVETGAVIDSANDPIASRRVDQLLGVAKLMIEPVTEEHAQIARQAYRDFGKGSGHPAQLNLGDCFSYALAKATGESLLFKGLDFSHTDVPAAAGTSR